MEEGTKRKIIGVSDFPKPYKQRETHRSDYHSLSERRRDYSIERWTDKYSFSGVKNFRFSEDNSSLADNTNSNELSNESLKEKIRSIPSQITESQKLLKTSIFQTPAPQYPTKCLILNIYKIKQTQYEDKSTSPPPAGFCSQLQQSLQEKSLQEKSLQEKSLQEKSLQEIDHLKYDNLQQTVERVESNKRSTKVETPAGRIIDHNVDACDEIGRELNGNILNKEDCPLVGENIETLLLRREANKNSLTPRSRSKFEHLIKTLSYSNEEEQLVLYKVLQSAPVSSKLKITESVPYKGEPKVSCLHLTPAPSYVLSRINTPWSSSGTSEPSPISAPATHANTANTADGARSAGLTQLIF